MAELWGSKIRRFLSLGLTAFFLSAAVFGAMGAGSRQAEAIDRDVKAVMVVSTYGLLGGTVLGLAALPFNQDIRTVFIGSSLGLYLGIAIGIYYVYDRYDQNNPLRMRPGDRSRENGAVDRDLRSLASTRSLTGFEASPVAREPLRVDVPVLTFY
jgi:hypothetical protein